MSGKVTSIPKELVAEATAPNNHSEGLPKVSQTSSQLLCRTVVLMIKVLGAIVHHSHHVRVVVLVVVVERVEEQTETDPLVTRTINRSLQAWKTYTITILYLIDCKYLNYRYTSPRLHY